jgi:hypothetical protein
MALEQVPNWAASGFFGDWSRCLHRSDWSGKSVYSQEIAPIVVTEEATGIAEALKSQMRSIWAAGDGKFMTL